MAVVNKSNETISSNHAMKFIRSYVLILVLVLPLAVFVGLKAFNPVQFESDAVKRAAPSLRHENFITPTELVYPVDRLIIDVSKNGVRMRKLPRGALHIPADSILDKHYLKIIRNNKLPVVLASDDQGEAAGIWMLLSQMGVESLYILRDAADDEILKYKFRPDTTMQAGIEE